MGREKSTKLFSFEAKKCPCSLFLAVKNDCCHDSSEILIIDDFQAQASVFAPAVPVYFELGTIHPQIANIEVIAKPITQYIDPDFSPPPKEPLYRINCSLVLYEGKLS